jgi:hypothetical protein
MLPERKIRRLLMTRNKRTDSLGHEDLTPLTEQILARMGPEGADIRARLKNFYRRRSLNTLPSYPEPLEKMFDPGSDPINRGLCPGKPS